MSGGHARRGEGRSPRAALGSLRGRHHGGLWRALTARAGLGRLDQQADRVIGLPYRGHSRHALGEMVLNLHHHEPARSTLLLGRIASVALQQQALPSPRRMVGSEAIITRGLTRVPAVRVRPVPPPMPPPQIGSPSERAGQGLLRHSRRSPKSKAAVAGRYAGPADDSWVRARPQSLAQFSTCSSRHVPSRPAGVRGRQPSNCR